MKNVYILIARRTLDDTPIRVFPTAAAAAAFRDQHTEGELLDLAKAVAEKNDLCDDSTFQMFSIVEVPVVAAPAKKPRTRKAVK